MNKINNPKRYILANVTQSSFVAESMNKAYILQTIADNNLSRDYTEKDIYTDVINNEDYLFIDMELFHNNPWYIVHYNDYDIEYNHYNNTIAII